MTSSLFFRSCWLLCLVFILTSCKTRQNRALQEDTKSALEALSVVDRKPETKYHELTKQVVILLEDALSQASDSAMLADMRVFVAEEKEAISGIQGEFDYWFQNITHAERIDFLLSLQKQAYVKKLTVLESRFRKRAGQKNGYMPVWEEVMATISLWR